MCEIFNETSVKSSHHYFLCCNLKKRNIKKRKIILMCFKKRKWRNTGYPQTRTFPLRIGREVCQVMLLRSGSHKSFSRKDGKISTTFNLFCLNFFFYFQISKTTYSPTSISNFIRVSQKFFRFFLDLNFKVHILYTIL